MKIEPYAKDVELFETSFEFSQDGDGNDPGHDNGQSLKVSIETCGDEYYVVLATKRWAIDFKSLDAFVKMLKGMNLETKKK